MKEQDRIGISRYLRTNSYVGESIEQTAKRLEEYRSKINKKKKK